MEYQKIDFRMLKILNEVDLEKESKQIGTLVELRSNLQALVLLLDQKILEIQSKDLQIMKLKKKQQEQTEEYQANVARLNKKLNELEQWVFANRQKFVKDRLEGDKENIFSKKTGFTEKTLYIDLQLEDLLSKSKVSTSTASSWNKINKCSESQILKSSGMNMKANSSKNELETYKRRRMAGLQNLKDSINLEIVFKAL